jgi:hypothetical protein
LTTVPLGRGAYSRAYGQGPEVKLQNRFFETNPANLVEGAALLARPGTSLLRAFGSGPIRATFSKEGLFSGDLFVVSLNTLYRWNGTTETAVTGTVASTSEPSLAGMSGPSYEYLFVADGAALNVYTGAAALVSVATPDSVGIVSVAAVSGYVLCVVANSQRVYFILPGEITIDPLNFFSAESAPDDLISALTVGDQVGLFGQDSTEWWYASGDADVPFRKVEGRVFERGVVSGTPVVVKDEVILVGSDGIVYSVGAGVRRISDHGIENRIRTALE